ncbi:hypothetical protein C0992_008864 [Termitomyces sp. T32_za158]|nr:hypothetical protein C0992_008864 [Termitomyces sp. T32_za158]
MSGVFVYNPPPVPVTYGMPHFQTPYIHTPRSATPFIPDSPMFPPSPYSRPPSLNPSPNRATVALPHTIPVPRRAYDVGYDNFYDPRRERLPLWQEGNHSLWPGAPPPSSAPMDNVGLTAGVSPYSQRRRHSFSSAYSPLIQIHPFLNAEAPVDNFFFDLSSPTPDPLLYYQDRTTPVLPEVLAQPATYPLITRLRIISDNLPQEWDIHIDLSNELVISPYASTNLSQ